MRPWLQDPDGDGVYTFTTTRIPAGSYDAKVAHGLTWDENYGAGGAPGGANIGFSVVADTQVTFSYTLSTHLLTISSTAPVGDLAASRAQWLQRGLVAWDLPAGAANYSYRLYWAPQGGLSTDAEAVLGGSSIPLRFDPKGLPAKVRGQWPQLAGYDALRLSDQDLKSKGLLAQILQGRVAVAAFDDLGRLVDATGVQIPGVLDDLYSGARDRALGVTFDRGGPTFAVWAPTAQKVSLKIDRPGRHRK
jgi:hypothetical protein